MPGFNNSAYSSLVEDLLHDAFYLEARSNRGIISTIRQYAEVIVRKILNLSENEYVTLGNEKIIKSLKQQSNNNALLLTALGNIQKNGNKCTHTQNLGPITDLDVENSVLSLFNIYAYLYIAFFEKYKFGQNPEITVSFSILPPIIRYIVLANLYAIDPTNRNVIDKFSLAILKAFDEDRATTWLDERKDELSKIISIDDEAVQDAENRFGKELAKTVFKSALSMYSVCTERVKQVAKILKENGRLYDDFESAIEHYKKDGVVNGTSMDVLEFNSLMEFVYLGRKPNDRKLVRNQNNYVIVK